MEKYDFQTAKELWLKAVDTQMHFNEMSHKARQLGISLSLATLGISVGIYSRESIEFPNLSRADVCGLLILIAAFGMFAVSWLELRLYQRLLIGAVTFGELLEQKGLGDGVPPDGCGMTAHISFAVKDRQALNQPTPRKNSSQWTIFGFYAVAIGTLALLATMLLAFQDESKLYPGPLPYVAGSFLILGFGMFFNRPTPPPTDNGSNSHSRKGNFPKDQGNTDRMVA